METVSTHPQPLQEDALQRWEDEGGAARPEGVTFADVLARKERSRAEDRRAVAAGEKTLEQVGRENAAFAFGPDRASINLAASKQLV